METSMQLAMQYLSRLVVLLLCIPVHELAHGFIACRLGDPTAKSMGRLTLNPVKHLDMLGTLSMLLLGVGWAKPVPIDPRYFRNPKRDMAVTALAGPLSNLLMAFVSLIFYKVFYYVWLLHISSYVLLFFVLLFQYAAMLNVLLAVFNLIPIPPLDGSKILAIVLPQRAYGFLMRYEQIGMILVLGLMVFGVLQIPLNFITNWILYGMDAITFFVDGLIKLLLGET